MMRPLAMGRSSLLRSHAIALGDGRCEDGRGGVGDAGHGRGAGWVRYAEIEVRAGEGEAGCVLAWSRRRWWLVPG